jgi:two-component system, NarL family, sensor kinase
LPDDSPRLPKLLELVIFRVVQESVTNVHRHSGSPRASIRLTQSLGAVEFEIVDWGKGISEERRRALATAQVGVGVRGMEERVRQFGGTLTIQSSPAGTKITGTIPLRERD